ncbi:hypothetical protein V1477_011106 [Vespula maculifrons]|uniref:Uncharacterized protein n=1 Tax=Vespula maculifrons TaxID=7453 RepID=A0ABD2C3V6_VESMC
MEYLNILKAISGQLKETLKKHQYDRRMCYCFLTALEIHIIYCKPTEIRSIKPQCKSNVVIFLTKDI